MNAAARFAVSRVKLQFCQGVHDFDRDLHLASFIAQDGRVSCAEDVGDLDQCISGIFSPFSEKVNHWRLLHIDGRM